MTDEKLVPVPAIPGPQHRDHREIYTNTSKVGVGPWDIRLIFGHIIEGTIPNQQVMEDLVTIVMSPQHAKVLVASWEKAIKTYEDNFGVIPDLTNVVTAMNTQVSKKPG
jgi:hypothetical protein